MEHTTTCIQYNIYTIGALQHQLTPSILGICERSTFMEILTLQYRIIVRKHLSMQPITILQSSCEGNLHFGPVLLSVSELCHL